MQYWQYQQMIEGLNSDLKKHSLVVMDSCSLKMMAVESNSFQKQRASAQLWLCCGSCSVAPALLWQVFHCEVCFAPFGCLHARLAVYLPSI